MKTIFFILIAIWLFMAPWPGEIPHLLEKINWLQTGRALTPIDWFDIVMHGGFPPAIIGYLIYNFFRNRKAETKTETET